MNLSKARLWLTVILPFGIGFFVTSIFRTINAILAYPLMEELHFTNLQIGWITSMYVLTFAFSQIPLGLFLDSWGPRKTQTVFFFVGGVGIVVFGSFSSVTALSIGRGILGVGMAGGLMAAIKAVAEWVPKKQIPFYNGIILAMGGIGSLAATTPSKLFELYFGWRILCFVLGVLAFLIALLIFFVSPDKEIPKEEEISFREANRGLLMIYKNAFFWQITPLFITSVGAFIAMQGLWLGPWLQHVAGLTPYESSNELFFIAIGMTLSMLSGGFFAYLSEKINVALATIVTIGVAIHIGTQVVIVSNVFSDHSLMWLIYGYFAFVPAVNYSILSQYFGHRLSGRASTAANIFNFMYAFCCQYLFGVILQIGVRWTGISQPIKAYQAAFSLIILLELLALVWYFVSPYVCKIDPEFAPEKK